MTKTLMTLTTCVLFVLLNPHPQQSTAKQNQKPQNMQHCPMMQDAHSQMDARGDKAMGFSQTSTSHHFFLTPSGGVIQVQVNDPSDSQNLDAIRMHLSHIAQAFAKGNFDIPMFVHDAVPPGVPEMKRLQKEIRYSEESLPIGARVVIVSANKTAIDAIHQFLRFQISEHKTGDSMDIR